ncbi:MAG TPA: pilus assembly protein TadG-related protein [Actinomycetota bacterium]
MSTLICRRLRRVHDDEGGVVLLVVVFALLAVVGMLVLVFDLGSLVSTRRTAVKAADAAALAAAQSCFDGDTAGAPVAAQQVGLANMQDSGASLSGITSTVIAQEGCGTSRDYGYVTVRVTTNQDLFFAPIFGINSHGISAEATAAWGMVIGPPVPVMASIGGPNAFSSCSIPDPNPTPGETCYVLMDNNNNGGGQFGYLSLTDWYPIGTDPLTMDCNSAGGTDLIRDEIAGISLPRYVYGAPAWSCKVPGESAQTWPTLAGLTRWFPLTNPAVTEPSGKFYYVQGFAQATIISVEQKSWSDVATDPGNGNGNGGGNGGNGGSPPIDTTQQTCGNGILVPPNGSYSCIGLTWHTSLMPTPGDTAIAEGVHLIK